MGIRFGPPAHSWTGGSPSITRNLPSTSRPKRVPTPMVWVFSLLAHFLCRRAVSTPEMAKRFRSTRRRTRARSTSRTSRRSKRYQARATKRMASVQYHTFTLITQMGVTIDINKDYSRVAWTSPNTSGTITPLVALNDSNLFKSMLKTCDAFKIHSV